MEQKAACDNMIDEKNKLIHDFQQVINQCNIFFFKLISWSELGVDEAGPVSLLLSQHSSWMFHATYLI